MKQNIYKFPNPEQECAIINATVLAATDNSIVLDTSFGVATAVRAFSCLVQPEIGDLVTVNKAGDDYHVLAILTRPSDSQDACLLFDGNLKISTPKGNTEIVTDNDITLVASKSIRTAAINTQFISQKMTVATDKLTAKADDVESHSQHVKIFAKAIDTVSERISQRTDVLMRWVENVETMNIGNMVQNIRQTKICRSNQTIMTAKQDMRIDAERIHMG